jgi:addiction module HigA family antidote
MKKIINEPENGVLTAQMDIASQGFNDFQAVLLKKSKQRSEAQERKINLLAFRYEMEDYINSDEDEFRPVGDFLKAILKLLQIRQNKFAVYIGLKPSNLSKILNGERPINYDLAIIFGQLFDHDPMLWIKIQAKNEMKKLEHSNKNNYSDYSLNELISQHKRAG